MEMKSNGLCFQRMLYLMGKETYKQIDITEELRCVTQWLEHLHSMCETPGLVPSSGVLGGW